MLEVPSSTPGLSPITKASLSVAAMVAAGVRDLSFVSPTPRSRCSGAPPVVPPFRITRGCTKISDNSGEVVRIGSVVAASVWEDYEEIVVGDCELGSETDEDYLSDSHTHAHTKRKRQQLQRDLSVSSASSQIHPIQGRAREPQYEKELQISGSSSSGVFGEEEAEGDTEPEDSQELEPELENADMEMLGAKLASESICSTVSSIRSPLRMVSHDQKYSDGDDDASSALLSSLEFPCAQRASESVYSRGGSSSDDDRNLDKSKLACRGQKTKGGRCDGDEAHADTEAGAEADDDDVINSSADDEVLRVWDEQRQRAPPAFLLLESRYDPVDDRSLAADSEAAAAAAVMAAVAAEDDLFSPRLRHRSSQSLSQSLGPIDSTATVVTVGGSRRTGERYPYSTQRPIDHDTEAEDNDMSDINDVNDESGHADLAHLSGSTQQQQQQQQQQQRQSRRRQQVTVPLTQYLQLTQAQPPLSFTQNQPQQRQQQQVSTSEALPSTQYYVDHILTTSMLESLPLPELLPSSSSPAHLYRHAPHSRARREQQ